MQCSRNNERQPHAEVIDLAQVNEFSEKFLKISSQTLSSCERVSAKTDIPINFVNVMPDNT